MLFLVSFLTLFIGSSFAQTNPVSWDGEINILESGEVELCLKATVGEGWYIYSQFLEDGGPVATKIILDGEDVSPVGEPTESGEHKKSGYDAVFEMDVAKYSQEVTFNQLLKVEPSVKEVTGTVMFMTCNDEMCLPPKRQKFKITAEGVTFL